MTAPVIEFSNVVKSFRTGKRSVIALNGLSASVETGKITGLVGPDGAGKTTLMRLVAGLLRPDRGQVRVLGLDSVSDAQEVQSNIGYMPQRFGLYEDLSVAENLNLYADLHGLGLADRRHRFDKLYSFTGLGDIQRRLAGRLSGGMKQKLGLACTLVHPPRLLLLDEPSVGVDPVSRRELWRMIDALIEEGISVIWSTAYLDEAERCDAVLLLHEGRLMDEGRPASFTARIKGRTYALAVSGKDKRSVLNKVLSVGSVKDALIKGREVRFLLGKTGNTASVEAAVGKAASRNKLKPVAPSFEDAIIDMLKPEPEDQPEATEIGDPGGARNSSSGNGARSPDLELAGRPDTGTSVIRVRDLVRDFGAFRAIDHVGFEVKQGEIFGLLGPNGAGKSTMFKMLCGLLPPTEGQAEVLGIDLRRASAKARARIGYMAQKFSLYGNMTVLQNMQFFASAYGLSRIHKKRKIEEELDEFGLRRFADIPSADLPLGYKQRLALACAVMHAPGVLFLDEPTSGVDPLVRREFWLRINAMASAGVTIMVTTHFMEEAEYCDRIGIIYRGRMIAMGVPDDLKTEFKSKKQPDPTLEDAFINLIGKFEREHVQ